MESESFSRDELLAGDLSRGRRAMRLLTAIEARCMYMRDESRRVVAAYFVDCDGSFTRRFAPDGLDSVKLAAGLPREALHLEHLERFASQWKALLPNDPDLCARLIQLVHKKYAACPANAPRTLACLGIEAPDVQDCYEQVFGMLLCDGLEMPVDARRYSDCPEIEARLEWLNLAAGEVLFHAGDPGDALYVIISGRMQVTAAGENGHVPLRVELGRGEMLGEMAILTCEPRSATVRALRDSELVRLSRDDLFALSQQHLQVMVQVSALIIRRLHQQIRSPRRAQDDLLTFALLPCESAVPIQIFSRQLKHALSKLGPTAYITSEYLDTAIGVGAAQAGLDDPYNTQIISLFSELETQHRFVIYQATADDSQWSRRCLRQADRVVLVGRAEAAPQPAAHEVELLAERHRRSVQADGTAVSLDHSIELVLLHSQYAGTSAGDAAGSTAPWLAPRTLRTHHHVRLGQTREFDSLARRLSGQALGLTLGGGGARGFGHIGVLRALREMDIAVDYIGGVSMGALIGAGFALGMDDQQLNQLAERIGSRRQLLDRTLPLISFYATRKITTLIQDLSGERQIEDLHLPYFCVSCNLSKGSQMVHTSGPLWLGVRASMAATPIFSPILYRGDLLVDGGFLNNLPVDVMRQQPGVGCVVGIDCSPLTPRMQEYAFGPSISGWEALRFQMQPPAQRTGPPNMLSTVAQIMDANGIYRQQFIKDEADLIVRLPARGWGMLDFECSAEIIEASYRAASEQLAAWRSGATVTREGSLI